jgi:hypothetical protein
MYQYIYTLLRCTYLLVWDMVRQGVVSSEVVKVMVGKGRRGKRAADSHRINGRLSFICMLWPVILNAGRGNPLKR